ncbi:transcriptional regulator [Sporolactobacillus terrae]|uniref:helix-turn-helix transcriptional regulator n=1 Tax=Sporolactobacillus terrae TaxID=269673 RepID=UPI0006881325|nr:PAS domain-containing protein [Sporolactobacillus terrae]
MKAFVFFLSHVLGEDAEIVLYDVRNRAHSVIAMSETNWSGLSLGAPAPPLITKMLRKERESHRSFRTNYEGHAEDGTVLRSSTYFIRDEHRELIGALVINIDFRKMDEAIHFLDDFMGLEHDGFTNAGNAVDRLGTSIEDIAINSIKEIVSSMNVPSERMSQKEKRDVVDKLNSHGIFLLKGIVSIVASELKTSEATIYRYLSTMKKNELNVNFTMP